MPDSDSMNSTQSVVPQPVVLPLTGAAIFLVLTIDPDAESAVAVRSLCADLSALVRAVGFRAPDGKLACVMGIGSEAWDRLFGSPRPAELHPFREIHAGSRHAVATPGDLLFHIRAEREDLCFELEALIMMKLGDAVSTADEVHGFRYFDDRDVLGFVDGTENPVDAEARDATLIGAGSGFAGGSYVIVRSICMIWMLGTLCRPRRRTHRQPHQAQMSSSTICEANLGAQR